MLACAVYDIIDWDPNGGEEGEGWLIGVPTFSETIGAKWDAELAAKDRLLTFAVATLKLAAIRFDKLGQWASEIPDPNLEAADEYQEAANTATFGTLALRRAVKAIEEAA